MQRRRQLLDILYYCTHRSEWILLNVSESDWRGGPAWAECTSWCDEIHLNVIMISVCCPPGCIFVKEEKGLSTWRVSHVIWLTSVVWKGSVRTTCAILEKRGIYWNLSAHYQMKTIANSDFMCPLKNVLIHLFIKVLLQFLLHSPQLL